MAQTPHKTDPKATQSTPNASQSDTLALKTAQVVRQSSPGQMLNTSEPPEGMSTKKRRKAGRPTKYKSLYCQQIIEFFNRPHTYESEITHTNKKGESWISYQTRANPVPLMCDFAQYIGTTVQTLNTWTKQHSDFLEATTHAQDLQLRHLATITGLGLYNANWSIFMAKNISQWRDKKDVEHSGSVGFEGLLDGLAGKAQQARQDREQVSRLN